MYVPDTQSLSQLMDGEWQDLDPSRCAAGVCRSAELQAKWARYHLIRDALHNESVRLDSDLAARVHRAIIEEPTYSNVATLGTAGGDAGAYSALTSTGDTQTDPVAGSDDQVLAGPSGAATGAATGARKPGSTGIRHGWARGVAGFAMVASAALVTVVGLDVWQSPAGSVSPPDSAQMAQAVVEASDVAAAGGSIDSESLVDVAEVAQPLTAAGENLPEVEFVANRGTHWVTSQPQRQADTERRLNLFLSQHIENSPTADRTGMLPYSRLVGYDELRD